MGARSLASAFLSTARDFRLGDLPTEQRHPETGNLAELARTGLPEGLRILQKIDLAALEVVGRRSAEIERLAAAISETFRGGGRVFFYGCGATGRLALSIEYIWRFRHGGAAEADRVLGFMSGGDLALVHSIENFEDHPEFGARQVREIGFGENDLLVSCTEGGETPSVIGATEEAARISSRKPWFLYCNPDSVLQGIERSRRVLENPGIEKICLFVGPMSLSGSTRLQATTVLQLAAGLALFRKEGGPELGDFIAFLRSQSYAFLVPFIEAESAAYQAGEFFLYETDYYAITLLTDTTERSPTFSLPGFENYGEAKGQPSLAYLTIPGAKDASSAWSKLLLREPRALEWEELEGVAGGRRLYGFDFSQAVKGQREKRLGGRPQHLFQIHRRGQKLDFHLGSLRHRQEIAGLHPLFEHLYLKLLLNAHSLLVMGRLGRFESNVMTWVRPSNNKLVDRAIRYVVFLLEKEGGAFSYEDICYQLFEEAESVGEGESVVLKTVAALRRKVPGHPLGGGSPINSASH
jgi:N-acetylmuramic acid 6-phosphate etherase